MILGQDRNDENLVAHWYDGDFNDPGKPLCVRGWNRSDGEGYSIFRGIATGGICKICERRKQEGKKGVDSQPRKTKWI